jgi:hypothetical protein
MLIGLFTLLLEDDVLQPAPLNIGSLTMFNDGVL